MAYGIELTTSDGTKNVIDANTAYLTNSAIFINVSARNGSYWIPNFHSDTHDLYAIATSGFNPIWYIQNGNQFVWENYNGYGYEMMLLPLRKTY